VLEENSQKREGVVMPVLTWHNPKYSFPCRDCKNLSRNHRGEGYDFCTLLEIWIDPKLANLITCNARRPRRREEPK